MDSGSAIQRLEADPRRIAEELVHPVHVCIPGRARLKVTGLRRAPGMKSVLERGLLALPGVQMASASPLTGNLLVRFDPALPLGRVTARVTALARGDIAAPEIGDAEPPGGRRWYARTPAMVGEDLQTSTTEGLSAAAARHRLREAGANVLAVPPSRSGLGILASQFRSLPVALLGAAAVLSLVTGGAAEALAILAVLGLNGGLGYAVESRSERTIRSLGLPGHAPVSVVREGAAVRVPLENVVPGDLMLLTQGCIVPADGRIVSARDLSVSEAMLTGESLPVRKTAETLADRPVPLADRANMVYRGTAVTGGSGVALAVSTGPHTEMGRIRRLVDGAAAPETPMQQQLDQVGRQLAWASLCICGLVFGVGVARGFALMQMLRSAVSLAVAAIPEGLPTVATTSLALGVEEMRRHDVLVRRLDAIETLASVQVVCFDKTGTLTLNRMMVAAIDCGDRSLRVGAGGTIVGPDGQAIGPGTDAALAQLLRVAVLCSDAQVARKPDGGLALTGSATETALLRLALDAGLDVSALRQEHPRLSVRYRSENYRFMASTHLLADGSTALLAVKGSPGDVLRLCTWEMRGGRRQRITPQRREAIERANAAMAEDALRVLGFACRQIGADAAGAETVEELVWVGLAGIADPVRPGMRALVERLTGAGIHPLVLTGDQVATAHAVARQIGLATDGRTDVLDAQALDGLSPAELAAAARRVHAFARVSPAQKLRILRALQATGTPVAMVGDGINDSPALKAADVGIAMGGAGTEAARDVADIVLQTDDLAALTHALERGRATQTNVRRAIHYLVSTNLSEMGVVLAATAAGFSEPLTPIQLLWINLITDVLPGLGLAFEAPDADQMRRPPQPRDAPILGRREFPRVLGEGGLIAAGALASCGYGVLRHGAGPQARTMTLGSLILAQLLHAVTCRSDRSGILAGTERRPPNRHLTAALAVSGAAQLAAWLVPGLRGALGIASVSALDIAVVFAGGMLPFIGNEARKATWLAEARPPAQRLHHRF